MRPTALLTITALSCVPAFVALTPKPTAITQSQPALARSARPAIAHPQRAPLSAVSLQAAAAPKPGGGATVSASIINMFKNIVGSGVLALAAGVAAFSSAPIALLPSLALLLVVGGISGYTYSTIARVGDHQQESQ